MKINLNLKKRFEFKFLLFKLQIKFYLKEFFRIKNFKNYQLDMNGSNNVSKS